jgi:hypothetical protein
MRGRVIAVLLLLSSSTASPQCDFQLEYSGAFRATYFDLAIDGNDLWAATGYGLQLFDLGADPPGRVASAPLPGVTRVVRAAGGIAYASSGSEIFTVRKAGASLLIGRRISAGGSVNDLVLLPDMLYAATSNGIAAFSLLDPSNPQGGLTSAQTSLKNVLAIAAGGSDLYAADGDNSVEVFARTATLTPRPPLVGLPRSSSVEVAGSRIYVSDGIRTLVYQGGSTASIAEFPFGTSAVADGGGSLQYVAGSGRQFHALDATTIAQPVELFRGEIVPTGGNVNRVTALQLRDDRLYVAGGDAGLLVYDIGTFAAPYSIRRYTTGGATSIATTVTAVYVADAAGGISELTRSGDSLTQSRRWATGQTHRVHDAEGGFLLTSSGRSATWWSVAASTPAAVTTATFPADVGKAALRGTTAYALLSDGTLYSADLTQASPAPDRVTTPGATVALAAVSASGVAVAEITAEANTVVHFLGTSTASATIPGSASALAMDEMRAAVFTFRGISVIDFAQSPPAVTLLPASNTGLVDDLVMRENTLLDLSRGSVRVWDLATGQVQRRFTLPEEGTAIASADDSSFAVVASSTGVVSLNLATGSRQPILSASLGANDYYRKAIAAPNRLYLYDGQQVDIFETLSSAPHLVGSISAAGIIDVAASDTILFTLSSAGSINAYGNDGSLLRATTVSDGGNTQPASIAAVAGAPWVSVTRNCLTTGCEKKTLVFDPQSLVQTSILNGATIDATASAARAWAIAEQPNELRAYDISDPLHPLQTASRPLEGNASSIAAGGGTVYALGERLFLYTEALVKSGEQLTPQQAIGKIALAGGCATVAGRPENAEIYALPSMSPQRTVELPGAVRSLAMQDGRIVVLTDYSIEIWSRAITRPARSRVVR